MLATLTAEHLVVLDVADKLRSNLEKLEANEDLAGVKEGLWEFSRVMDQTVNQHFAHEEEELFPKLAKSLNGEVNTLLEDHAVIKQAHRSLQEELLGDKPSPKIIVQSGKTLLDRLEVHFQREHDALASMNNKK